MDRFRLESHLGSGAFGAVQLVRDVTSGRQLAVKCIKRIHASKYLEEEILNHSLLRHPHIIHFREVFLTDDSLCIVMEYANSGSLFNKVRSERRLPEPVARWFFQQLILAVDFSHRRGIANRDIKLENLLLHMEPGLQHPLLKMCDFGYSKADGRSAARSAVGTLSYMAPEVVRSCGGAHYDAKAADVWSCGVVLYVMLYGAYPFDNRPEDFAGMSEAQKLRKMLERMERREYDTARVKLDPAALELLQGLLEPSPAKRLTVDQIMSHPWFVQRLPAKAREMNEYYLSLPVPPEYQGPEQIRKLMDAVRPGSSSYGAGAARRGRW